MTKKEGIISILALDEKESGSKMHRIYTPLSFLHGKLVDIEGVSHKIEVKFIDRGRNHYYFVEEDIKENDILWANWAISNLEGVFSVMLNKYNTLYINDLDDYFIYPDVHIQKREENAPKIIRQIAQSDVTICATSRLKEHCRQYNPFVVTSFNQLPLGIGQFNVVEKVRGEKLTIGIIGSISHIMDWVQLKQVINRLAKNKEIVKNCKFVIAGYKKSEYWDIVVNLLKVKKNLEVEVLEGIETHEYMSLYESINVCLMPLLECEFNECKSELKLRECAIKGVVPIGSGLYSKKDGNVGILEASTPLEYEKWIEYLLKEDNFLEMSKKMSEINLKTNNFDKRIEDLRKLVEFSMTKEFQAERNKMPENLKIYGITYDSEQNTEYENILNVNKEFPWRFEYQVMLSKLQEIKQLDKDTFIGFLSHKFPIKTQLSKKLLVGIFKEVYDKCDMITVSPTYWKSGREYLDFSKTQHKGLLELLKKVCNKLGVQYFPNPIDLVFSNYYLLKNEYYQEYIEKWVIPSISYMENDIWEEVNKDSGYKGGLSSEELESRTGLKFYNFLTFITERLILMYIMNKKKETQFSSNSNDHFKVINIL